MGLLSSTSLAEQTVSSPKSIFDYHVIECIGQGAGSTIYAVSHPQTHQLYALKHVIRKTQRDARFIDQLENEYEVGRQVAHPSLRRALDFKQNRSLLRTVSEAALVMEMVDGIALDMQDNGPLPRLVDIFIKTAAALNALHDLGFVHCDLKPNNILVSPSAEVKVIDLGQAAKIGTAKQRIQGTPDYIAPEQVKLRPVTPRTDVFNLGATMYWSLTGRKLPTLYTVGKGKNSFLVDAVIPSPHQLNPLVPETLSNFVMECTRTNPEKRPQAMTDVVRRLEIIHHAVHRLRGA
jgi:eukaryotic-like serine/threonine-protein kinase